MTSQRPSDFVGRRVRDARTARGWTAKELAARCAVIGAPEITAAVIANIETGRRDPDGRRRRDVTVDELLALAYAFEMSPAALLRAGEWAKERIAITAPDGDADAPDVAAWVAGEAPAPVRGLLGGLARCASCGSDLWLGHPDGQEPAYHCINSGCPDPVSCRADFLEAYAAGVALGMLQNVPDLNFQRWKRLPRRARQDLLRLLVARLVVKPGAMSGEGFHPSSVEIEPNVEPAGDSLEADA